MKPNKCRIMCPDCGRAKMQFNTEKEAQLFIKFNGGDISDNVEELRVYYCTSCCCYHISSKPSNKKYEERTNNLINAYYRDINSENKKQFKKEIKEFIEKHGNVKIKKTGRFHITQLSLEGQKVICRDEDSVCYTLQQCHEDELKSILNKLNNKHYTSV